MAKPKKDHLALPAQTLRRFREHGNDEFLYIDVKSGVIDSKGPAMYQKRKGYYLETYDAKVRELEDALGKISESVIPIAENDEQDARYNRESLKNLAISLIAMQTHRRPELKDAAMESDRINELIDSIEVSMFRSGIINGEVIKRAKHYRQMLTSEKAMQDYFYETTDIRLSNITEKLGLHNLGATYMKVPKEFQTTFILTPYHYIQAGKAWFFTITPRLAIALLPNERFNEDSSQCGIWEISEERDMDLFIPSCIKMALQSNPPHLIGERFTLEKVKALLKSD